MIDVGQTLKLALFIALGILSATFIFWWARSVRKQRDKQQPDESGPSGAPTPAQLAIGFGTNFFDTLGIGSFATTTAAFKLLRIVRDEYIPGTLIIGHTLPVVAQAFIFMTVVSIDPVMLVLMILAMVVGGWLGAGIVSGLPRRLIQVGMGIALLLAALSLLMSQFGLFPAGGPASGLPAMRLLSALVMNFIFGALCTLGIGNYAPSLVLFSLLGMDPRAAFPVMMGSGAFTGIVAGIRFLNKRRYDQRAALGLMIGGIPAVLLAAFAVKSLSLDAIRWLVLAVIVYTAVTMLRSARAERLQRGHSLRQPRFHQPSSGQRRSMSHIRPTKFAHVVYRTRRFAQMLQWYETVFDARVQYQNPGLAFLTYDDEHHRFAFANMALFQPDGVETERQGAIGVDHVAYTYVSLHDLLENYARLKEKGIRPYWCVHHGITVSMYYADPDGNQMEFQVDSYNSSEEARAFINTHFGANPVGVEYDPEDWLARLRAGTPASDFLLRQVHEPVSPLRGEIEGLLSAR